MFIKFHWKNLFIWTNVADVFDVFALFIHDVVKSQGYGKVGISLGVRKISFIRRDVFETSWQALKRNLLYFLYVLWRMTFWK